MSARVTYAEAAAAERQALSRACEVGLSNRQWRVLAAVLALTSTYSKLVDETYVGVIAELARLDPRHARRELNRLDRLGVIVWMPANDGRGGRGRRSRVALPAPQERGAGLGPGLAAERGAGFGPGLAAERGADPDQKGGPVSAPRPRRVNEKRSIGRVAHDAADKDDQDPDLSIYVRA